MQILAISGSLRAASLNTMTLKAAQRLAPPNVSISLYRGLADLPAFNPDLEAVALPAAVLALREAVGQSNGLLIASPEYAHGVAGAMKNALDWLVGSLEFPGLAVAVVNASHRASIADGQLREILRTMSARIIDRASIRLSLPGNGMTVEGILADPDFSGALSGALDIFVEAIKGGAEHSNSPHSQAL